MGLPCVSVPLRGVGCFPKLQSSGGDTIVSVPLRGVGCFFFKSEWYYFLCVSVPLRGVGCFLSYCDVETILIAVPSPCGVWVVSP